MSDARDRCPTCDRSECAYFSTKTPPAVRAAWERISVHVGNASEQERKLVVDNADRFNALARECEAHAVDWRSTALAYRIERKDLVAALREVCKAFGDNDWPDDLHLADVIEKHLAKHLHEAANDRRYDAEDRDANR